MPSICILTNSLIDTMKDLIYIIKGIIDAKNSLKDPFDVKHIYEGVKQGKKSLRNPNDAKPISWGWNCHFTHWKFDGHWEVKI